MINVERSQQAPQSLNNAGIQSYLDEFEAYKNDQRLPAEHQTLTKPKCHEAYRNADLFDAFDNCFSRNVTLQSKPFLLPGQWMWSILFHRTSVLI